MVAWERGVRSVSGSHVTGGEVGVNVSVVDAGEGAGVGSDASDGWFKFLERAVCNTNCWPAMGVDAKVGVHGGSSFM